MALVSGTRYFVLKAKEISCCLTTASPGRARPDAIGVAARRDDPPFLDLLLRMYLIPF